MRMHFMIIIKDHYKNYRLIVEHTKVDSRTEYFKVSSKTNYLLISSNRPFFRSKGLKHRRPDYDVIEGTVYNISVYNKILDELNSYIERHPEDFR